jgi:protein-S-isoprenylcysteine O-methyltransferase Ste14
MIFLLRALLMIAVLIGVLFGCAGRWDLPFFWAYIGLFAVLLLAAGLIMPREVQEERLGLGKQGEDRWLRLFLLPFFLGLYAVAGLDLRFEWSGDIGAVVPMTGLASVAIAWALVFSAVLANRFFAPAIRLQHERGQYVVTTGPYSLIRHPTYAAMCLASLCTGPALGSWWALLPALGLLLLTIRRTALEDRFLRANLPGYAEYSTRVRARLLPGVW